MRKNNILMPLRSLANLFWSPENKLLCVSWGNGKGTEPIKGYGGGKISCKKFCVPSRNFVFKSYVFPPKKL